MAQLSVVVPFFDVDRFAAQTLASLARNVDPRVEMILVDDASTDTTPELLAAAAARLPRTRVVTLPVNRGLSAARNAGVDAASGRYLTFLDGDDVLAPGHLADLLDAIERLGCDFVRTDHVRDRDRRREVRRIAHGPRDVVCAARSGIGSPRHHSAVDYPYAWAGVYDRDRLDAALLRFDEDLRTCEDRPWIWRLHLSAATFAAVGLHGVRYRRAVAGSLSQRRDVHQLDFLPALERVVAMVETDRQATELIGKAVRSACAIVCWHLEHAELYTVPLAARLWRGSAELLARLPAPTLATTIAAMGPERTLTLTRLREAA